VPCLPWARRIAAVFSTRRGPQVRAVACHSSIRLLGRTAGGLHEYPFFCHAVLEHGVVRRRGGHIPDGVVGVGEHLDLCKSLSGRLFAVRCVAELTHGFVAARFVTTLVVVFVLIGLGSLMF